MRLSTRLVSVALAGLCAVDAAALPPAKEIWSALETPHVRVATNGAPELARVVAGAFEELYDAFGQVGGAEALDRLGRGTVVVFRDRASAAAYWQPNVPDHLPGFVAIGGESSLAVLNASAEGAVLRTVYKQFLLPVVRQDYPQMPPWLLYGLVEYLSTLSRQGDTVTVGHLDQAYFYTHGARNEAPTWAAVIGASAVPNDDSHTAFLGKATLLIHYALSRPVEERRRFAQFLRRVGGGEEQEAAWRVSFGTELAALGPAADGYLASGELKMLRFELAPKAEQDFVTRAMPRVETLTLLAELLARFGPSRRAAALDHFTAASELEPENGTLWKRRAELYRLAGQADEARPVFARAAALLPADLDLQLAWALGELERLTGGLLQSSAIRPELPPLRAALAKVTAARSDDAEAWKALAAAWSYEPIPPAEGVAAFERAFTLNPERVDFGFNTLLGRVRSGNAAGAEQLLSVLEAKGADELILERARNAIATLDYKEAVRLARAGKATEAAGWYARVLARATDPALVKPAANALAQAAKAGRDRVFIEAYLNVIRLFEAGDSAAGREALEKLAATAQPGSQAMAVAALRGRWGG